MSCVKWCGMHQCFDQGRVLFCVCPLKGHSLIWRTSKVLTLGPESEFMLWQDIFFLDKIYYNLTMLDILRLELII